MPPTSSSPAPLSRARTRETAAVRSPLGAPHDTFLRLVAAGAAREGCNDSPFPGLRFFRASRPASFRKMQAGGVTLTAVAQGRKLARLRGQELAYDGCRYLVVTGEGSFEGKVVEASEERPYLAVCLEIPADQVARTLLALADHGGGEPDGGRGQPVPAFTSALDLPIKSALNRLLQAIDDPLERRILAPLALEELVFRLFRTDAAAVLRSAVERDRDAEPIQSAMQFIRTNAGRPLSVKEVARRVGMSPSHFAHRFRAVARVSPMRYLKQIRMQQARELMLANGLRVSQVAAQVGYESASHFSRDFKSTFGARPAQYARRFQAV